MKHYPIFEGAFSLLGLRFPAQAGFLPLGEPGAVVSSSSRSLIVFFSQTGNTRALAKLIQKETGGDLHEIVPVNAYTDNYQALTEQAKRELKSGYCPPLKSQGPDPLDYDVIYVGSPNWWNTFAAPVRSYLSSHRFEGKTLVPFITHEGTRLGDAPRDIARLCPGASIAQGLAVWGREVPDAEDYVHAAVTAVKR